MEMSKSRVLLLAERIIMINDIAMNGEAHPSRLDFCEMRRNQPASQLPHDESKSCRLDAREDTWRRVRR